jgi:hypothetical protein
VKRLLLLVSVLLTGCSLFHPVATPPGLGLPESPVGTPAPLTLEILRVDVRVDEGVIVGRTSPGARVSVADRDVAVDDSGYFTATVGLAMGMNFIPVVARLEEQQKIEIVQARRVAAAQGEESALGGVAFSLVSAVLTSSVGADPLVVYPHGQFLVVEISVRNNRPEPVTLWDEEFVLQDKDGNSYHPSVEGTFAYRSAMGIGGAANEWSPGTEGRYALVFDIPTEVPEGLVLRAYSGLESWAAEVAITPRR